MICGTTTEAFSLSAEFDVTETSKVRTENIQRRFSEQVCDIQEGVVRVFVQENSLQVEEEAAAGEMCEEEEEDEEGKVIRNVD